MLQVTIIFEDHNVLVVNKPAGMVVNRSDTSPKDTLQDWAEDKMQLQSRVSDGANAPDMADTANEYDIEKEFADRGGIVHRLDKDTSGVMLIAKNPQTFGFLKEQFKNRTTEKEYLTLVHGVLDSPVGEINAPIERSPFNRMQYGVFPGGREALTKYQVLKEIEINGEKFSFVKVNPKTGRTHQIRVHFKYLGHPVVCDPIYGGRKQFASDERAFPRLFLHAFQLKIEIPDEGVKTFEAPLPEELQMVVQD